MIGLHKTLTSNKLINLNFKISKKINNARIIGLYYKKLKTFTDKRGDLTELWSAPWTKDEPISKKIKHVYFNTTHQGVIKGWHFHEHTFSQYTCVKGKMQVVLVDIRKNSKTYGFVDQFIIGEKNPSYIKIPFGVLKAWKSLKGDSILVNLLTTADVNDNYKFDPELILGELWQK